MKLWMVVYLSTLAFLDTLGVTARGLTLSILVLALGILVGVAI